MKLLNSFIVERWVRLAKRDLNKIKKKKRFSLHDAYEIGRMEVELISVEEWAKEN